MIKENRHTIFPAQPYNTSNLQDKGFGINKAIVALLLNKSKDQFSFSMKQKNNLIFIYVKQVGAHTVQSSFLPLSI